MFRGLGRDLRYALRTLSRQPLFTFVAVLTAGIGIGATTAVYSTVDWLLDRSPGAVVEPERIASLLTYDHREPEFRLAFSYTQYQELRDIQNAFTDIAAYAKTAGGVSTEERADQVVVEFVTGNYFHLLGLRPHIGRALTEEDDRAGSPPVVVLSQSFWLSHYGGDPDVLQSTIRVNGQLCRVVGVMPGAFEGYYMDWNGPTSVWAPMQSFAPLFHTDILERHSTFFPLIGRLKPDESLASAAEKARAWAANLTVPADEWYQPSAILLIPGRQSRLGVRDEAEAFLGLLLAVSGLILLAACFNIANFLVGRGVSRRAELALRAALGASRWRLFRQLTVEAAAIGLAASAFGLFVAFGLTKALSTMPRIFLRVPLTTESTLDLRMVGVAIGLGIVSALVFGLLPAALVAFRDPTRDLKDPKPSWSWGSVRVTPRQALLALQVALSVALAITAGLYARSFLRITEIESGYADPHSVLVARVRVSGLTDEERTGFYRQLLPRLNQMPEVVSASIGWNPPMRIGRAFFSLPGRDDISIETSSTAAAPRFFETLGIPLIAGREFDGSESDLRTGMIINHVLAERLFAGDNAVGRAVLYGDEERVVTGVVRQDRCGGLLREPHPCSWRMFPETSGSGYLRIRTRGEPVLFVPALREVVHQLHRDVAVAEAIALDAHARDLTGAERASAIATLALAVLGIVLLTIGCVSLFVSMVRDSVREIAIRLALGAGNGSLKRRILAQGLMLTLVGIGAGLLVSRYLALRIADQLYRTEPMDPVVFMVVPLLIASVGLASVYWSAVLATRTDPASTLRCE